MAIGFSQYTLMSFSNAMLEIVVDQLLRGAAAKGVRAGGLERGGRKIGRGVLLQMLMHTCPIREKMPAQDYPKWYPHTPSCAGAITSPHISAEVVGGTGGMAVLEAILTFKSDLDDEAARQLAVQHLLEPGALYPPQIYGPVIVQWVRLNGVDVTVPGPPHPPEPEQPDSLTTEIWVLIGLGLFVAVTGRNGFNPCSTV